MKLTFWGAARQVTGSMFLLELKDAYKILIDCGTDLSSHRSKPASEIFPFNPADIDVVLLTHAHIDHSGNIPLLYQQGYKGQILCTSATNALTELLLRDSAFINSKKLQRQERKKRYSKQSDTNLSESLFLDRQVDKAVDRFVPIAFNKPFEIRKGLTITFIPTGHLLGAANIVLEVEENGRFRKIGFSGDIGRKNYPLLQDPHPFPKVDYLICESTYGNRSHNEEQDPEDILESIIRASCIEKKGRLIIPAFSIGRTQSLLYTLNKLFIKKNLPPVKVFADSPMAEASTRIYEEYVPILNQEAQSFYKENQCLFDFENLHVVETYRESKAISNYYEPCIIIASSGMLTGGRMQDHIKKNLDNPYCTILMVGYSAEGTPGYDLLNGHRFTKIKGRRINVSAQIISTDIFSGHADREDLLEFINQQNKNELKQLFLVHGEYEDMTHFKNRLQNEGYHQVVIPAKGECFEL
ncbi:MAG TPA: MBL fold metallo-hydrolase [Cytophagaceae bacterium]